MLNPGPRTKNQERGTAAWLCHQLGSREHYSIPRALHLRKQLALLQTDCWVRPSGQKFSRILGQYALAGRYHPDLSDASVRSFTIGRLAFDLGAKIRRSGEWKTMTARDQWFQRQCQLGLEKALRREENPVVFSYAYGARQLFRSAKACDAPCILGQIDPGTAEYEWLREQLPQAAAKSLEDRPAAYWAKWREEIELADRILVNSTWSKELLVLRAGVPAEKIGLVPLAYSPKRPLQEPKSYPKSFTQSRPLRLLFLGQVIHRKGVHLLLEAMQALQEAPIHLDLAGPMGIELPNRPSNITVHGPVDRDKAEKLYRQADLFILPTLSDGFALTQLEAAAHRLPLIVSRYCGQVVQNQENGILLHEVSAGAIQSSIQHCLDHPADLTKWSAHELDWEEYSLETLGKRLVAIADKIEAKS